MKKGFKYTLEDYIITEYGDVINKHNNHVLKPIKHTKGYLKVCIGGKKYYIHRLVAEKYIPNPENKTQINHKDGDKTNNKACNLEWVTNLENRQHAVENKLHYHKLTDSDIDYILKHSELSSRKLGNLFNVTKKAILDIRHKYK